MIQTKAQRGREFARSIWRAAITTIVILLLCVPPAWAATICDCQAETRSRHGCCLTSDNECQNQASIEVSSHCKNTQPSRSNFQVRKSSQHAMSCCEASPLTESENAKCTAAVTVAAEENNPPPVHYQRQILAAPSFIKNHPRQPQRPLYLALSCWLI